MRAEFITHRFTFHLCMFLCFACAAASAEEVREIAPFGKVHLMGEFHKPAGVILFISGDGGWEKGVVKMAEDLGESGYFVAGLDIREYYRHLSGKGHCIYAAAEFESLSQALQKTYGFQSYFPPVLVGYSSGATLVYAIAAQSPPGTFAGAVSMGFCPDLETARPLCAQNGLSYHPIKHPDGFVYEPAPTMATPWVAFQGDIDQVCDAHFAADYTAKIPHSKLDSLPKVGHGFSVRKNWWDNFVKDIADLNAAHKPKAIEAQLKNGEALNDKRIAELPLTIERPQGTAKPPYFAILYSGDGGWADIDREIAKNFNAKGIPVVGMNSLQYLWSGKTQGKIAEDLGIIFRNFSAIFGVNSAVLVGYSRGADMIPPMLLGLDKETLPKIRESVLIAPSTTSELEFHLLDWVSDGKGGYSVLDDVKKLNGRARLHLICGADEDETSLCKESGKLPGVPFTLLPGGHHFKGNYALLNKTIEAAIPPMK